MPFEMLFDAARRESPSPQVPFEVPLWSGIKVHAVALLPAHSGKRAPIVRSSAASPIRPLWDVETALIRKAVQGAHGNVMQAARELGISRATVYRKIGSKNRPKPPALLNS